MLNERKLTKTELNKREDVIRDMKKNKHALVKKYGKDAEKVMYGRATNVAKKQTENMEQSNSRLKEMVQDALKNPKKSNLNIDEDLDLGHEDNEPHMLKSDLYRIGKYAMELYQMVDQFEGQGEVDFPAWWQSKISNAKTAIVSAKHYLDFELKEPEIDAMVSVAAEEEAINEMEGKFKKNDTVYDKHTKAKLKVTRIFKDRIYTVPFNFPGRAEEWYKAEDLTTKSFFEEGMSEEEWAKAKEEDRLAQLPLDQQLKIKKIIAMMKAEKKSK